MSSSSAPAAELACTTVETALCVIPPQSLWEPIQVIRSARDHAYPRWPPHINFVYPFVPVEDFPVAAAKLRAAFRAAPKAPIHCMLGTFDTFRQRGDESQVWLKPDDGADGAALRALHAQIVAVFPQSQRTKRSKQPFVPHLSVGQTPHAAAAVFIAGLHEWWSPLSFDIDEVALIARPDKDTPFRVCTTIKLDSRDDDDAAWCL